MLRACLLAGLLALGSAQALAQTPPPSLRERAESGDPEAAYAYGYALSFPEQGEPDTVTGRYWLIQAANAGLESANYMLGILYRDGFGVDVDIDRARAFFELAWQAGDPSAGHDLAELMLFDFDGERVAALAILDSLLAEEELGPIAALTLAETLMFQGDEEADAIRAVSLAQDAIERQPDLVRAYYIIGIGAAEGLTGAVDYGAARQAWQVGAEAGDTLAMIALGDSWLDPGWGVIDRGEAVALYALAADFGDEDAATLEDELRPDLDPAEQDRAMTREGVWRGRLDGLTQPD